MRNFVQNHWFGFSAALLLHLLIFAVFFHYARKSPAPQVAVETNILLIDDVSQGAKKTKNLATKKEDSEQKASPEIQSQQHSHATFSEAKKLAPLFNPLPQIPDELREEAFASEATARFHIAADGSVSQVELVKPCANPKLNQLLLQSLKRWQFSPAQTSSTQDICVHFLVK